MDKILIEGGNRLVGEVVVGGAKNAVLPLMAAALLTDGWTTITNVPRLRDIDTFKVLLSHLGSELSDDPENRTLKIRTRDVRSPEAPYELVKTMRAAVLVLGPLVARFKRARVSLPGGCAIGARPIDLHLKGLKAMGAEVVIEHGYVTVSAEKLKGAKIYMDTVTVTGTENLMLAAVHAEGTTILENAALEPEVVCLADALNKMGARITGAGTEAIKIEGVDKLNPVEIRVIPDRIEAGTFMVAAAMTRGNVLIKDCPYHNLDALNMKLKEAGTEVIAEEGGVRVTGDWPVRSVDVKTLPYPGFPTDMQAQVMAMMSVASGLSVITETVFENRFMHVGELKRMGADITIDGRSAVVRGVKRLSSAPLMATDLRASASLILAGLVADGTTEVSRIYHLDRGYEKIEEKLVRLGANIKRVKA
ncbi:MAG TPA: UDP-N-acetylglucosamine 1-carboxyvinyltransferase [Deltaproteobacteria bacterium]|nr:MAG: UDP-N-acetylglucosamine 1-carboxyvinyltransferase [Deltaproteobacteria bacterium GWA2_55_82]OGQ62287.1 MAG: UDP-N-acetylglucosamine 1-carboxyvinyltransferase [Deltaproteobacteria bacterium RIFCSPLOWO2_02_FULL_55_12]OIJ74399.1 MAG: UDP-N-acetylglucosamine 1-carboxyvinyltransferase [Deltaproteobacteria bacterium GWC2_55_46]HBG47048.1 UDP-N-acetylglucosamine 1-carboxyvinyltransferase [Deltaproteobacteria bacterium]HCY10892.1 UDP-N-acetylglucosamine 1-carboxyvinyltransferase [Deltaproteobac